MDHNQAIQLQAAVKYVLGELSQAQRDEYEEHYFDCAECAVDIKALATFADTTREVLRQEKANQLEKESVPASGGWLRWFQPVVAVPAFAALLLIVAYQNTVTIPQAKRVARPPAGLAAAHLLPVFSLLDTNVRGGSRPEVHTKPGESFALKVDITDPDPSTSSSYALRLVDSSGAAHILGTVSREEARNTVFVEVPAGFPAGNSELVVLAMPQPGATPATVREISRIPFVLAFSSDFEHHP